MSLYKMFETNKDLEAGKGVTIDYGDAKVTIHRAGGANRKYATVLQAKMAPVRYQVEKGTLPDDKSTKLLAEVYAESIIIGWEGVIDADGNVLEFTKENVVKVLTDLPDFFSFIQRESSSFALFRKEEIKADAKN